MVGGIGGILYSRVNNGEMNARYPHSTRPTASMDKLPSFEGEPVAMCNYGTLRGNKINGFTLNVSNFISRRKFRIRFNAGDHLMIKGR